MSTDSVAVNLSRTLYYRRGFPLYCFNTVVGLNDKGKGIVYSYDAVRRFQASLKTPLRALVVFFLFFAGCILFERRFVFRLWGLLILSWRVTSSVVSASSHSVPLFARSSHPF